MFKLLLIIFSFFFLTFIYYFILKMISFHIKYKQICFKEIVLYFIHQHIIHQLLDPIMNQEVSYSFSILSFFNKKSKKYLLYNIEISIKDNNSLILINSRNTPLFIINTETTKIHINYFHPFKIRKFIKYVSNIDQNKNLAISIGGLWFRSYLDYISLVQTSNSILIDRLFHNLEHNITDLYTISEEDS